MCVCGCDCGTLPGTLGPFRWAVLLQGRTISHHAITQTLVVASASVLNWWPTYYTDEGIFLLCATHPDSDLQRRSVGEGVINKAFAHAYLSNALIT